MSTASCLAHMLGLLLLIQCRFEHSPYSTRAANLRSNEINLKLIEDAAANTTDSFKVAFISDTHNYYKELGELISVLNKNGPYSFVVVNGDITNVALLSEFEKSYSYFNKLHYPFLVVAGNHDLVANGALIFSRLYGPVNYSLEFKNTQFVFYNNNNWETTGEAPSYSWVFDQLRSSGAEFKILVAHIPPQDRARFSENLIFNWMNMVNLERVNYVFSGHNHSPGVAEFGDAINVTIGAVSKRTYFELTISPGAIEHKKVSF